VDQRRKAAPDTHAKVAESIDFPRRDELDEILALIPRENTPPGEP